MKATGIVRRIDSLGRVVIPKELRTVRGIAEGDPVEIFVDGSNICLRKVAEKQCCICKDEQELLDIDNAYVCKTCAIRLEEKMRGLQG